MTPTMTPTTETKTQVLVFCTNVHTPELKQKTLDYLRTQQQIADVSLDLEDCDRVLRVVTDLESKNLIELLTQQGITCTELI